MNITIIHSGQSHVSAKEQKAFDSGFPGLTEGRTYEDRDYTVFAYEMNGTCGEGVIDHANATEAEMIEAIKAQHRSR